MLVLQDFVFIDENVEIVLVRVDFNLKERLCSVHMALLDLASVMSGSCWICPPTSNLARADTHTLLTPTLGKKKVFHEFFLS